MAGLPARIHKATVPRHDETESERIVHRLIAVFSILVATMWTVIAVAEYLGDRSIAVIVTAIALAFAFDFAGYRLIKHPPDRFR